MAGERDSTERSQVAPANKTNYIEAVKELKDCFRKESQRKIRRKEIYRGSFSTLSVPL